MEIIGVILVLLFLVGTLSVISICFRWIDSHILTHHSIQRFIIKTLCVGLFILILLIIGVSNCASIGHSALKLAATLYFITISSLGVYTLGKDYYLYVRRNKALHKNGIETDRK